MFLLSLDREKLGESLGVTLSEDQDRLQWWKEEIHEVKKLDDRSKFDRISFFIQNLQVED